MLAAVPHPTMMRCYQQTPCRMVVRALSGGTLRNLSMTSQSSKRKPFETCKLPPLCMDIVQGYQVTNPNYNNDSDTSQNNSMYIGPMTLVTIGKAQDSDNVCESIQASGGWKVQVECASKLHDGPIEEQQQSAFQIMLEKYIIRLSFNNSEDTDFLPIKNPGPMLARPVVVNNDGLSYFEDEKNQLSVLLWWSPQKQDYCAEVICHDKQKEIVFNLPLREMKQDAVVAVQMLKNYMFQEMIQGHGKQSLWRSTLLDDLDLLATLGKSIFKLSSDSNIQGAFGTFSDNIIRSPWARNFDLQLSVKQSFKAFFSERYGDKQQVYFYGPIEAEVDVVDSMMNLVVILDDDEQITKKIKKNLKENIYDMLSEIKCVKESKTVKNNQNGDVIELILEDTDSSQKTQRIGIYKLSYTIANKNSFSTESPWKYEQLERSPYLSMVQVQRAIRFFNLIQSYQMRSGSQSKHEIHTISDLAEILFTQNMYNCRQDESGFRLTLGLIFEAALFPMFYMRQDEFYMNYSPDIWDLGGRREERYQGNVLLHMYLADPQRYLKTGNTYDQFKAVLLTLEKELANMQREQLNSRENNVRLDKTFYSAINQDKASDQEKLSQWLQ